MNRISGGPQAGQAPPIGSKVAFLSQPGTYPGVAEVEVRETHMAWVFLAGDRAYKIKKPVRHSFLDYSSVEARHRVCEAEVRLNRRLAPDVYLGLSRLTADGRGQLALDGAGETVDWIVVMRRLPAGLMLDAAIRSGTATPEAIAAVADRLTAFYRSLAPEAQPAEALAARFMADLATADEAFGVRSFASVADRGAAISARLEDLLRRRPTLLAGRAAKIVEGHGDLRPEHVCLTAPPVVIDCLEFSRDLRLVDPFDELAYLGMECAVFGASWIAPILLERGARDLGERPDPAVIAFYTAFRAVFRARQALVHLLEPHPRTPEKWLPLASLYLDQSEEAALSLPPR